jgi:hypothetical protein
MNEGGPNSSIFNMDDILGAHAFFYSLCFEIFLMSCVSAGKQIPGFPGLTQVLQAKGSGITASAASAEGATNEESILAFAKNDNRRMLHVVYRVGDLDKTIKYSALSFSFNVWT